MTSFALVPFLDKIEIKALTETCHSICDFFQTEKMQRLLIRLDFPLYVFPSHRNNELPSKRYKKLIATQSSFHDAVCTHTFPTSIGPMVLTPDSHGFIVITGRDTVVKLHTLDNNEVIWIHNELKDINTSRLEGDIFLIEKFDRDSNSVHCINFKNKTTIQNDLEIDGTMRDHQISSDGKYIYLLVSNNGEYSIQCFDLETGKCLDTFTNPVDSPCFIQCLIRNGTEAISDDGDGNLIRWEVQTGNIIQTLPVYEGRGLISFLKVSADGNKVIIQYTALLRQYTDGGSPEHIAIWDLTKAEGEVRINQQVRLPMNDRASAVAATSDLKRLFFSYHTGQLLILDLTTNTFRTVFDDKNIEFRRILLKADGTGIVAQVVNRVSKQTEIKVFAFDTTLDERLKRLALTCLTKGADVEKEMALLPLYIRNGIGPLIDADSVDRFNAKNVCLAPILERLQRAKREPDLMATELSRVMEQILELSPSIQNRVLNKLRRISFNPWDPNRFDPTQYDKESQTEFAIAAITETLADFSAPENAEGKRD